MRALICGWFSYELMGATAGDLMTCDLLGRWFDEVGILHDVALAAPFTGGVDWQQVEPARYSHLAFVCGPFGECDMTVGVLERFGHCHKVGLNLSMLDDPEGWNPFDLLLERDSVRGARTDMSFACDTEAVPVVGVILVKPQQEYGDRARHAEAERAIEQVLAEREVARVSIDTRLDENIYGLRTPREIESLIARMDAVVTTRLHGTALALKNGVPALAIDPIHGGAKIRSQAREIGWPYCYGVEELEHTRLLRAFDRCLRPDTRGLACAVAARAATRVDAIRRELRETLFVTSRIAESWPA